MAKGYYNPRQAHRMARKELKQRVGSLGLPCAICGKPIDYTLPQGDPWCYELDEIIPISLVPPNMREKAALDRRNVQPVHRICNERRSNKLMTSPKVVSLSGVAGSIDWLGG